MSGGCFEYIQFRVKSECLDKLKRYMDDGLVNFDFNNIEDYKFMLHNLFEGFYKIAESTIWMDRLDWYLEEDDGEEAFRERLNEELRELADNKKKDCRCFDCTRMGHEGCTLLYHKGKTITLTDFICGYYFISVDWSNYKVKGNRWHDNREKETGTLPTS
jgi:hypothetical protein